MKMKWFKEVKTVEELRKKYKELLKMHHPDNGGSIEITQEINAEYDVVFANLSKSNNADNNSYTQEDDEEFRAILNAIIGFNITIELIGSWIWCFNSYEYKDQLKALNFKYAPKKKAWCWHSGEYKRHGKEVSLNHIRQKYGSETIRKQEHQYSLH